MWTQSIHGSECGPVGRVWASVFVCFVVVEWLVVVFAACLFSALVSHFPFWPHTDLSIELVGSPAQKNPQSGNAYACAHISSILAKCAVLI